MKKIAFIFMISMGMVSNAVAHSGGTDANGCHTNQKTGKYHCHKRK